MALNTFLSDSANSCKLWRRKEQSLFFKYFTFISLIYFYSFLVDERSLNLLMKFLSVSRYHPTIFLFNSSKIFLIKLSFRVFIFLYITSVIILIKGVKGRRHARLNAACGVDLVFHSALAVS